MTNSMPFPGFLVNHPVTFSAYNGETEHYRIMRLGNAYGQIVQQWYCLCDVTPGPLPIVAMHDHKGDLTVQVNETEPGVVDLIEKMARVAWRSMGERPEFVEVTTDEL